MHRFLVDRLEIQTGFVPPESDAKAVDDQGAAVGNGDPPADSRGPEVLAPLEHLEQDALGFLIQMEETHQLLQSLVLCLRVEVEVDRVNGKEVSELHLLNPPEEAMLRTHAVYSSSRKAVKTEKRRSER